MSDKQDLTKLFKIFQNNVVMFPAIVDALSEELGVSVDSINRLGVGFYPKYQAWTFAERDAKGNIIGIACRCINDKKLMIEGSKHGLFYQVNSDGEGKEKYKSGAHNWTRVGKDLLCPVCGKDNGCAVASSNPNDPPAVMCVHQSKGSVKPVGLGHLHILKPEGNIGNIQTILPTSELPIIIVEGASDVLAAMDLGFVAIGRFSAEGGTGLLSQMPLHGKEVWIIGENDDGAGRSGMEKTFAAISKLTDKVSRVLPPEGIKDLRKWVQHGLIQEELIEYMKQCGDASQKLGPDILSSKDPIEISEGFFKRKYTMPDGRKTFHIYVKQNMRHDGHGYITVSKEELDDDILDYLAGKKYPKVKSNGDIEFVPYIVAPGALSIIIRSLGRICRIDSRLSPPVWLNDPECLTHPDPANLLVFQNGILNKEDYKNSKITLQNPDPNLFTFSMFPYDFDENAKSLLFEEYCNRIFKTDLDRKRLLAQWFGYNIIPDMSRDTIMLFIGDARSGKTTLLNTMEAMLGSEQCVATDFDELISPFGREPMVGKLSALLGDVSTPNRKVAGDVLRKLLRISGTDAVGVNRKGIKILSNVHLNVRFSMIMNNLPVFTDDAGALPARLAVIDFDQSFVGREKPEIRRQLIKEAKEGKIINFALEGLKDLEKNNKFIVPRSSIDAQQLIQKVSQPIKSFINECCIFQPELKISVEQVYDAYKSWCVKKGCAVKHEVVLGRALKSVNKDFKKIRPSEKGERFYFYEGLGLHDWVLTEHLGRP